MNTKDEQFVFEAWLKRVRPSGDAESVQRHWEETGDYKSIHDCGDNTTTGEPKA